MESFYGLIHPTLLYHYAYRVCEVLGHGSSNTAVPQCLETVAAETQYGSYYDHTVYAAGMGIGQTDEGTFSWLKGKYANRKEREQILDAFGIDIREVEWRELAHSPLLSLIFVRLRYKTVTAPIPNYIEARAEYWKQHYNGAGPEGGKGTPAHYLASAARFAHYMTPFAVSAMLDPWTSK